jgi:hypothetical protein
VRTVSSSLAARAGVIAALCVAAFCGAAGAAVAGDAVDVLEHLAERGGDGELVDRVLRCAVLDVDPARAAAVDTARVLGGEPDGVEHEDAALRARDEIVQRPGSRDEIEVVRGDPAARSVSRRCHADPAPPIRVAQVRFEHTAANDYGFTRRDAFAVERRGAEPAAQPPVVDDGDPLVADALADAVGEPGVPDRDVRRAQRREQIGQHRARDVALEDDGDSHRRRLPRADERQRAAVP